MNKDTATLQSIADTLKENPMASQRDLAENSGMSIGLMNAVLKRFVERGWIMLTNVNMRKLSYALTPEGLAELSERSHNFARRTFALANQYNDKICDLIATAKKQGKTTCCLYGPSYIKFLLVYACQVQKVMFVEKAVTDPMDKKSFCVVGELCEEQDINRLKEAGAVSLVELVEE